MTLDTITARLRAAEIRAGRSAGSVTLVAVSKVQPEDRIIAVLEQGHRVFGENRVQEAQAKWPALRDRFGPVALHLIGPLQTNKARAAVGLFDAIHSVDRPTLVETLARLAGERGRSPDLFIQVNTGAEPQKSGCLPEQADSLVTLARSFDLPLRGLMCIPPDGADPVPHFHMLAEIAARNGLAGLSMGMSADFEAAIAAGATHVRIGSAVFGERAATLGPAPITNR